MELARHVTFTLHTHPNADKLSIAKIAGTDWACVTQTAQWGDPTGPHEGIYVGIDALVSPTGPFDFLKPTHKFPDGRPAHKIKTVRLRGALSQGLLIPVPHDVVERIGDFAHNIDWTASLGIERYEPEISAEQRGDQVREPGSFLRYTKIENAKNWPNVFSDGEPVRITEKLHGSSFRAALLFDDVTQTEPTYHVGSHVTARDPAGANLYSTIARKFAPEDKLRKAAQDDDGGWVMTKQLIVYGEIYGHKVQDLHYGHANGEKSLRIFDVLVDGEYKSWETVCYVAHVLGVETVPLLFRGPFAKDEMALNRDGNSSLTDAHVREGVVVTADPERYVPYDVDEPGDASLVFQGRAILKYISDAYLERHGAKDGH